MQQVLPSAMHNAIYLFISRQNIFCLKDMYIYVCHICVCVYVIYMYAYMCISCLIICIWFPLYTYVSVYVVCM